MYKFLGIALWGAAVVLAFHALSPTPSSPLHFILVFAGLWGVSSFAFSLFSGWFQLAQHYRTDQPCPEAVTSFGYVGQVRFQNALKVGVSRQGLYLRVVFFLRLGHPPLLIPWSAITRVRRRHSLLFECIQLDVGDPRITTLRLEEGAIAEAGCFLLDKMDGL